MGAQLESHLRDINRTADIRFEPGKPNDAIDLVVVTDAEAILGIGGESATYITYDLADIPVQIKVLVESPFLPRKQHSTPSEPVLTLIVSFPLF